MSERLKGVKWKEFFMIDVFQKVESSKSQIDKIKLTLDGDAIYPYVTRSAINNGIDSFIPEQKEYSINNGNVITIGLDTQTVFYQKNDFYTGQNIQVISDPKLNEFNALFLIPLIKKQMSKFNWGGNGATLSRLKRLQIMLPVNSDGNIDWIFMESFIKGIKQQVKPKIDFVPHKITDHRELEDVEWREFVVQDIATITGGRDIYSSERILGDTPYITSTALNNGIGYFISNNNNTLEKNCISINRNGSVGFAFYHNYYALYGNDVRKVRLNNGYNKNKHVSLFVTTILMKQKDKYSYSVKMGTKRLQRQKIMLPITPNDEPDWIFMEQYMKRIENRKMKEVLSLKSV